jgi:hypothetical protein
VYEHDADSPQPLDYHEIWMLLPLADGGSLRPAMSRLRGNPVLCMRLLSHVAEAVLLDDTTHVLQCWPIWAWCSRCPPPLALCCRLWGAALASRLCCARADGDDGPRGAQAQR